MDVALRIAALSRDESDDVGEERQPLLPGRVEEPFGAQLCPQTFQALELIAEAGVAHRRHREREIARLHEVVALHARDDPIAELQIVGEPLEGR